MAEQHLRRPAVETLTGLSRSSLYAMMEAGAFPRPVRIRKRAVAWPESTVAAWLAARPSAGKCG
ncbi:helix-turn-helix transcriptional regulator [Sulfitobacter sp. PS-8MA]|uniref:helix-turn-helix transcriptional regulator n=1 Tax=Sulfitobacter sp. PS-8MA TaxID=3237707 RepID=UPI0034C6394D